MIDIIKKIALWLWQAPQNILGLLLVITTKGRRLMLKDIRYYHAPDFPGGIALGEYIISYTRTQATVLHEYGHVRQSRLLGPLYLPVIGLPSLLWAALHGRFFRSRSYYWFYTERWADRLGGVNRRGL